MSSTINYYNNGRPVFLEVFVYVCFANANPKGSSLPCATSHKTPPLIPQGNSAFTLYTFPTTQRHPGAAYMPLLKASR